MLARLHEFGRGQHSKVKGKRWTRQAETARNRSRRQSVGRMPDKQTKNAEPRFLSQRGQRPDCMGCLHISKTMEL
jgi:hypothetical protein